jgi:hypothetical protein
MARDDVTRDYVRRVGVWIAQEVGERYNRPRIAGDYGDTLDITSHARGV